MSSPKQAPSPDDELDRNIAQAIKFGLPIVIVLLVILAGVFVDASSAVLVAAAGSLIAVIAVFWASLRTLLGETPLSGADAYVFGAPPRVEEEQKRAVLRALKDIEFERNVGKISEEDYRELAKKYRDEAKRLLQAIDEKSAAGRERAEALVQKKLRQAGLSEGTANEELEESTDETNTAEDLDKPNVVPALEGPSTESAVAAVAMIVGTKRPSKTKKKKAKKKPAFEPEESVATNACPKCKAANDKDAVFCKKCGTRVSSSEEASNEEQDEAKEETSNDTDEEAKAS